MSCARIHQQINLMGYAPRYLWGQAREEWLDHLVDEATGARALRVAMRRLRRTFYVALMRMFQQVQTL